MYKDRISILTRDLWWKVSKGIMRTFPRELRIQLDADNDISTQEEMMKRQWIYLSTYTFEEIVEKLGSPKAIYPTSIDTDKETVIPKQMVEVKKSKEGYKGVDPKIWREASYKKYNFAAMVRFQRRPQMLLTNEGYVSDAMLVWEDGTVLVFWNGIPHVNNKHWKRISEMFPKKEEKKDTDKKTGFNAIYLVPELQEVLDKEINERIAQFPLLERFRLPTKRGIILHGKPGTGKTSIGVAIKEKYKDKVNFTHVTPAHAMGGGFSFQRLFQDMRHADKPSILFLEDADVYLRDRKTGSGGTGNPMIGELLDALDGFQENKRILVILSTNHAFLLDEAIVRPGRFDVAIEVKLVVDPEVALKMAIAQYPRLAYDHDLFKELISQKIVESKGKEGISAAEVMNYIQIAALDTITNGKVPDAGDDILDVPNEALEEAFKLRRAPIAEILKDEADTVGFGGQRG